MSNQELNICRTNLHRIPTKVHLQPHKVNLTQVLHPTDHLERRHFTNVVGDKQAVKDNFFKCIIFREEAYFHLDINKGHCQFWAPENPCYSEKTDESQ